MNYAEKLRDPRWQRKRLEVLNRFDFTCVVCNSKNRTLHVHHSYYLKGRDPWEYPTEHFWCLCETCHDQVTEAIEKIHRQIGMLHPVEILNLGDDMGDRGKDIPKRNIAPTIKGEMKRALMEKIHLSTDHGEAIRLLSQLVRMKG